MLTWIDPHFLDSVWPEVEALLRKSISLDPSYTTVDQLQLTVRRGGAQLLTWDDGFGANGVATVEFIDHPRKRVAHVTHLAGVGVVREEVLHALADWCKAKGATALECWAGESRARLYRRVGFTEGARVMRLEL